MTQIRMLHGGMTKARKDHVCFGCGVTISKGERYFRDVALLDGSMYTVKCCRQKCECLAEAMELPGNYEFFKTAILKGSVV